MGTIYVSIQHTIRFSFCWCKIVLFILFDLFYLFTGTPFVFMCLCTFLSVFINQHFAKTPPGGGGGVYPYLGMVGRFRGDDPRFGDFQSDWVPILYINTIRLTTSFGRKNRFVSITFSSRDTRTYILFTFSPKCIFNRF